LKVVHIVEALGGGVYTYFKDLSFFFGAHPQCDQFDTYIIYSGNRKEVDPSRIRSEFSPNVTLIEMNMARELSPVTDLKSAWNLYRKLKELKPDVIHLHSSKAGVLGRVANFFLGRRNRFFYTPHGYAFLRRDISGFSRALYKAIEKYMQVFLGGTTIACGDTEYEIAKKNGKALLVRNGIGVSEIRRFASPNSNERLTIGIVARITAARAPKLFNEIAEKFPQYDFVWIGDGEFRHELSAKNINVTGWTLDPKKIMARLNTLDVYLQTSLWEGLPLAMLEAMALQKPVVATNIIGNKDVVVHGETGYLFDSIDQLPELFGLLQDKSHREELGRNGLLRCEAVFDNHKNLRELADIYQTYKD